MKFEPGEVERIEDAQLLLLGLSLDDIARMSLQQRYDVMEIARVQANPKEYLYGKESAP